jgi:ABC-type branched-subunit amino acid transport system ATPase component
MLRLEKIEVSFGGVLALRNLSFEIAKGEILGLVGPNGAGKNDVIQCHIGIGSSPRPRRLEMMGTFRGCPSASGRA